MKPLLNNAALVVLNYNTPELTIGAVRHVIELKIGIRLIVVDNASTDDSWEKLNATFEGESDVTRCRSPKNGGYAKGNNLGLSLAEKLGGIEYVGIMNPDVVVGKDALYALVNVLKQDKSIGFATTQTIYNGKKTNSSTSAWKKGGLLRWLVDATLLGTLIRRAAKAILGIELDLKGCYKQADFAQAINTVFAVQGCFFFGRIETFSGIGAFDSRTFLYHEENILAEKIRDAGLSNVVLRDFWIQHNHGDKDKELQKRSKKLFHLRCMYESRCLYLKEYSGYGRFLSQVLMLIWKIDFAVKKSLIRLFYQD